HNPNFQKKIDFEALKLYFNYGYILAPHTIFKDTYKLLPGSFLSIDLINRKTTQIQYWDVKNSYNKEKILINEEEAIIETEKILKSACEYRTVADVPFGIFLSGGYDSSLITSILQTNSTKRIKTFTLGFSQKNINEAPFAKNIANYLATDHSEYYCNKEDVRQMTEMMPYHYDEPFGDS
ncbi:MAG: asparagine synthetase B, partial [Bacteroidetes bacterium B1(2017)]